MTTQYDQRIVDFDDLDCGDSVSVIVDGRHVRCTIFGPIENNRGTQVGWKLRRDDEDRYINFITVNSYKSHTLTKLY